MAASEQMHSQPQQSQHAIWCAADKELHGHRARSVLFVYIEGSGSQCLRVEKRAQMKSALGIHKMRPHRRRVRMLAILRCRVIWRKKSRAGHAQMKRAERRSANQ